MASTAGSFSTSFAVTIEQHKTCYTLDLPPITIEEIVAFWKNNFKIHARVVPVVNNTKESKVIKMFTNNTQYLWKLTLAVS